MAKNKVIAGNYQGEDIICVSGEVRILISNGNQLVINKSTVAAFEVVDENYKKSTTGVIGRAAVGAALLGPVGLLAGATAKNKGTHVLSIKFHNGSNSLIEVGDRIYKAIIKQCF